jgi:hypothetical protein
MQFAHLLVGNRGPHDVDLLTAVPIEAVVFVCLVLDFERWRLSGLNGPNPLVASTPPTA